MKMKSIAQKSLSFFTVLACLTLGVVAGPIWADVEYDPEVIMQVPHQPILNNEKLPGTTGNTGSLSFDFSIKVAPGRGGLQPELVLSYNSSSRKNSWVGVGWSLELGSIERSKKTRVDFDDNDRFIYNGSMELVARPDWGSDYYGARIEEEFIKLRYLGNDDGWIVYFPDGRIHYLGSKGNSQLQTAKGVFRWLLDEIEDANGNSITVTYTDKDGDAIYPQRINYSPGAYVQFYYERRKDVYPVYSGYTRVEASRRLEEIRCIGSGSQAHRYELTYDYSGHSGRSLLASIREFGSGRSTVLPATTFSYEEGGRIRIRTRRSRSTNFVNYPGMTHFADINGDGFTDLIKFEDATLRADIFLSDDQGRFGSNSNREEMEAFNSTGGIHFGDINGDGKADCVVAKQALTGFTQARAYLGDSRGELNFTDQVLSLDANTYAGLTQLADVNGDGRADLIEFPFSTGTAMVHLANSSGEFEKETRDSAMCAPNESGRLFLADVNGDGMGDVVQTNAQNTSVYVHLARGNGQFSGCSTTSLGHATDSGGVNFGDLNGDGMSDIILTPAASDMAYTYFSNGLGGYVAAEAVDTNHNNHSGYVHFGDFSGDGFTDMVKCAQFSNRAYLFLGDGAGDFDSAGYVSTANNGLAALVDINNDGLSDLLKFETNQRYVYAYMAEGLADGGVRPDILNYISHGYGVTSSISYRPSTAYGDVHEPSKSYPGAYLPFPVDLVDTIVVNDGIGHTATTSYDYIGARYHIREREFLGLGRIWRQNPNNTTLATSYHVGSYYLKGKATRSNYDDNGSRDYLHTRYAWDTEEVENGSVWVHLESQKSELRSGSGTVDSDIDYVYKYDRSDDFGYLYETIQSGDGESKLTTRTTFDNVGGSRDWILRMEEKRMILGSTTSRHIKYRYDRNGNLTRETHENNNGSDGVINRRYDTYGNVTSETDLNGNSTVYAYTSGTFVSRENFEGLTTTYSSYNQWGKPGRMRDPNGGTTRYDYDGYGRVTREDYPGSGRKDISYKDTARPRYTITTVEDGTTTYDYVDGLDRPLQTTVSSAAGRGITTRIYYDTAGRVTNTVGPFFTSGFGYYTGSVPSSAPYQDTTSFDFLNRPESIVSTADSGTATTRISYSGFNRTITDPDGKSTTEYRDYLGRIQSIRDADGETTSYNYTGAGDMTLAQDSLGNQFRMTRNTLGHMTRLDDPDLGRWNFTYRANGDVRTRRDQQGQTITYSYNNRNQLTSKGYAGESPSEPDVSYTYNSATNGNGRLYRVTKGAVSTTYTAYDDMGRVTRKTVSIDGVSYPFSYYYDAAGNLTRIVHPDGYGVSYSYHSNSNLIASVWASGPDVDVDISDYNNFEKPGRIAYLAFTTDIDYFDRTGRVRSIYVPGMMSLSYDYSRAGDVLSIYDSIRDFAYTYKYDDLHRLIQESASGPFRLPGSRTLELHYNGTETHAVSRVTINNEDYSLIYEDNGNMTLGYDFSRSGPFPERRIEYNAENMPLSIEYVPDNGPSRMVELTYDGDGRRVKKVSGTDSVIYVDNTYEIRNGQPVKYIFAGNLRVAKVQGGMVHYYHKDHLGSSAIVTDTSGTMMESLVFEAFGQPRPTCTPESGAVAYTYTDQEWDAETGLYNYDARLYDAVLGRFLSADSMIPDWYNPQALNRYSYVLNNPLAFLDPDGHAYEDALRVWNSFVTNPDSAQYGLPKQAGMFSRRITYIMPFTAQFKARLAYMDSKGIDVTKFSHQQLGQEYHQEVLDNITLATEGAGAVAAAVASRGAVRASATKKTVNATGFKGSKGFELKNAPYQKVRNTPATINNRNYSGHALDQMQNRGLTPSVVENTIQRGTNFTTKSSGTTGYYDAVNKVRVITNSETGRVVTVIRGAP